MQWQRPVVPGDQQPGVSVFRKISRPSSPQVSVDFPEPIILFQNAVRYVILKDFDGKGFSLFPN
jgi:hypothetical protein